jgi:hypothetical protein
VIPPGKFYDAGVVKPCPMGTYREGTLPYAQAVNCTACGEGVSTLAAGSNQRQDCTGELHFCSIKVKIRTTQVTISK